MIEKSISILMPAHNEEKNIVHAVTHTLKTCQQAGIDFDIIIINDASQDDTGKLADQLARDYPQIRTYHHPVNQGSGGGFRTGIEHSTKEYCMFVPMDNPLDPDDLESYLPKLGICDIIVGTRCTRVGYSLLARWGSFFYNRICIPLLYNLGLNDVNWIQAYRREIFTSGHVHFDRNHIFWLVQILISAKRKNYIIAEVPSKMKKRLSGEATCLKFKVMWRTFFQMISYFIKIHREKGN